MKTKIVLALVTVAAVIPLAASHVALQTPREAAAGVPRVSAPQTAADIAAARMRADVDAMRAFRPGYAFWQHVFTMQDGTILFGSARDGRLLAAFPAKGEWARQARWIDPGLAHILDGQRLAGKLTDRRDQVEGLIERAAGPVLQNSTRGDALIPNTRRYGAFLNEWGAIYERFGVPADIGLAQVILESGLSPTRRSEANAIGFCQWLQKNWKRLNYFSPTPIEGKNQTTQAPYCAAYLSVLATKYGSFIPALSEHNAGGTNVGRTLINGEHLGAHDVRAQYLTGSKLAHDLRALPGNGYGDVYRSYGPRSYLYAEMVFGNTFVVQSLMGSTPQRPIYAMRTPRAIPVAEIVTRTGLSLDEVRRYNPALTTAVPAQTTIYLPSYVSEFGDDVAFWRRPAPSSFTALLDEFMHLDAGPERWDDPAFAPVLTEFQRRFGATNTEEGRVMETVLAYSIDQAYTSGRRALLAEFRTDGDVRRLIDRGVLELGVIRDARASLSDVEGRGAGVMPAPRVH
jgi:hypothetical protein